MSAVEMEKAEPAAKVPEKDEVFAQDANAAWAVTDGALKGNGKPMPAKIFAAWRTGRDVRQLRVGRRPYISSVARVWFRERIRHVQPPIG